MMSEDNRKMSDRNPIKTCGGAGGDAKKPRGEGLPPAGPHARPELIDEEKTPGTGLLPEQGDSNSSPTG